jgi:hypothetical protein
MTQPPSDAARVVDLVDGGDAEGARDPGRDAEPLRALQRLEERRGAADGEARQAHAAEPIDRVRLREVEGHIELRIRELAVQERTKLQPIARPHPRDAATVAALDTRSALLDETDLSRDGAQDRELAEREIGELDDAPTRRFEPRPDLPQLVGEHSIQRQRCGGVVQYRGDTGREVEASRRRQRCDEPRSERSETQDGRRSPIARESTHPSDRADRP